MTNDRIRLSITKRHSFADGFPFGDVGPYETLAGSIIFSVNPEAPQNQQVVDLDKAPRNIKGQVEFTSDFCILKPVDMGRSNHRLLFEFVNRGFNRTLQTFNFAPDHHTNNPRAARHAGDGFLMRRGYTLVWAAWQGDILPGDGRLLLKVPVAIDDGNPVTGKVRSEFIASSPGLKCFPLSGYSTVRSYPAATTDTSQAILTCRQYADSGRTTIGHGEWQYARIEAANATATVYSSGEAIIPSSEHIYLPAGFKPGWIYELIYPARDPLILGLGYVAIRNFISFLKYADVDSAGNLNRVRQGTSNELKAYCVGRSQTGRVVRDFIYQGFNADSDQQRVFDGAFSHVSGAGRIALNHRWAQPVRLPSWQHEEHYNYADRFPFSYARSTDHLTGQTDAILKRPETDPVVIHTQSSTEYWQRHGSLIHTDTKGNDLPQPGNVRVYLWSSSQHRADPQGEKGARGVAHHINVVSTMPLFRTAIDWLDRWITEGVAPPPNEIPMRNNGTLVTSSEWRTQFPEIPGAILPREANRFLLYDYGPEADDGYITYEPPRLPANSEHYPILVPSVDEDGNEVAGIRMPMIQVPLGTYTGWNIVKNYSPGVLAGGSGSYLPFPATEETREMTGDPRSSLQNRYESEEAYLAAIKRAAEQMADKGFLLLEEDLDRILDEARWAWNAGPYICDLTTRYF